MRILLVNHYSQPVGGAEHMVTVLQRQLELAGHDVRLLAGRVGRGAPAGPDWFPSCRPESRWRYVYLMANPIAAWRLWRIVRTWRPQIVHLHNTALASPLVYAALRGQTVVMTAHDHTVFDPASLPRLPTLTPHAEAMAGYFNRRPNLRRLAEAARFWLLRAGYRRVSAVVACSRFYGEALQESRLFRHVEVLPNGLELGPVPAELAAAAPPNLLFAGRIDAPKGLQILLAAWPLVLINHPETRLRVAGTGPHLAVCRVLAAELGIEHRVIFTGQLSGPALAAAYEAASAVVVPSVYPDNLPTVAIEAMAASRPVIASNIGGLAELVQPGQTGYLVPPADPVALAASITRVLAQPATARAMGRAGRQWAEAKFSASAYAVATLALYQRLLSATATNKPPRRPLIRLIGRTTEPKRCPLSREVSPTQPPTR